MSEYIELTAFRGLSDEEENEDGFIDDDDDIDEDDDGTESDDDEEGDDFDETGEL